MKYAIITVDSKQYRVEENKELTVEKLSAKEGDKLIFNEVNLLVDNEKVNIGQPYLTNISVTAKVLSHYKDKKIRVATYKAKSRYRKVKGHRQKLTKIQIEKITFKKSKEKQITPSRNKKK